MWEPFTTWSLGIPTRKPLVVRAFSEQVVELVIRVLVQPESRIAFSEKGGKTGDGTKLVKL